MHKTVDFTIHYGVIPKLAITPYHFTLRSKALEETR